MGPKALFTKSKLKISLYVALQKHKLDQSGRKQKNFSRQAYSFLEVKLWRFLFKLNGFIICKPRTVLANSSNNYCRASQYRVQVNKMFTVNSLNVILFFLQKQITWRLKKTYLVIEMSLNRAFIHGKLQRCQTQRSDRQRTAEIMQTYDDL